MSTTTQIVHDLEKLERAMAGRADARTALWSRADARERELREQVVRAEEERNQAARRLASVPDGHALQQQAAAFARETRERHDRLAAEEAARIEEAGRAEAQVLAGLGDEAAARAKARALREELAALDGALAALGRAREVRELARVRANEVDESRRAGEERAAAKAAEAEAAHRAYCEVRAVVDEAESNVRALRGELEAATKAKAEAGGR